MTTPPAELLNPAVRRGRFRAVLFDFDGTLSLLREGWSRVMIEMMIERLRAQNLAPEPEPETWACLERLILAQNGAPTIHQMKAYADEVHRRGGKSPDVMECLQEYLDRLMAMVGQRWRLLESGQAQATDWVVPNVHAILKNLRARGIATFVASGSEYDHVAHEAKLLAVEEFFPAGINAPRNNDPLFRKGRVIDQLLAERGIQGEELLGFGDGMVETAEIKRVGGVAVGVASSEYGSGIGVVNPTKRSALIAAGADVIVADYARQDELVRWLWNEG